MYLYILFKTKYCCFSLKLWLNKTLNVLYLHFDIGAHLKLTITKLSCTKGAIFHYNSKNGVHLFYLNKLF